MKYILTHLLLVSTEVSAHACIDIRPFTFTIVQKIDAHTYELAHLEDPRIRMMMITKKAIFNKTGMPVGVKIREREGGVKYLPTKDGFQQAYFIADECGLTEAPDHIYYTGNWSIRQKTKEDKK